MAGVNEGSRPFIAKEMDKLYKQADGQIWTVTDEARAKDYVARKANNAAPTQKGAK